MNKSLFDQLGGGMPNGDMMQQFRLFVSRNKGVDPNAEINRLMQSGQITQQQYNQANQMAHNFIRSFEMFSKK